MRNQDSEQFPSTPASTQSSGRASGLGCIKKVPPNLLRELQAPRFSNLKSVWWYQGYRGTLK